MPPIFGAISLRPARVADLDDEPILPALHYETGSARARISDFLLGNASRKQDKQTADLRL